MPSKIDHYFRINHNMPYRNPLMIKGIDPGSIFFDIDMLCFILEKGKRDIEVKALIRKIHLGKND